ncbi:immunity 49 family protein [Actinomadura darangshiensis]|nr:immunity 49 family protein [Actinomadura darangshiensis]
MRVERHRVGAERLRDATEDFADRIGGSVHGQEEAGRDPFGWQMIGDDLLDYAGARSAAHPEIDRDAWTALLSASEAHLGAVELVAGPPGRPLSVFITYTGTGVVYQDGTDEQPGELLESAWQQALYLCVIMGDPRKWHEAFHHAGVRAASGYSRALSDLVFGDGARVADLIGMPDRNGERALLALAAADQDAFWTAIAAMLAEPKGGDPRPRTLLPLAPLALTALAVRDKGWEQRIESGYLPARLTGAEKTVQRPRVGPYGTDRKTFPVPVTVERPPFSDVPAEALDYYDAEAAEAGKLAWSPDAQVKNIPYALTSTGDQQLLRFYWRAEADPEGRDPRQWQALDLASQLDAAAFRVVTAPGDSVEITIGDRTASMRTAPVTDHASNFAWHRAIALALITGSRERCDLLLGIDPDSLSSEWDLPVHHTYHVALRSYLRGEPARPATDRAIAAVEDTRTTHPHHLGPFAVLLSQLVAGDREGFVAALVDALEEFRDHYSVGDRQEDPYRQVHIGALALTCHAHRELGWEIPVISPYLPAAIVAGR